jgi:hypothetical protein
MCAACTACSRLAPNDSRSIAVRAAVYQARIGVSESALSVPVGGIATPRDFRTRVATALQQLFDISSAVKHRNDCERPARGIVRRRGTNTRSRTSAADRSGPRACDPYPVFRQPLDSVVDSIPYANRCGFAFVCEIVKNLKELCLGLFSEDEPRGHQVRLRPRCLMRPSALRKTSSPSTTWPV